MASSRWPEQGLRSHLWTPVALWMSGLIAGLGSSQEGLISHAHRLGMIGFYQPEPTQSFNCKPCKLKKALHVPRRSGHRPPTQEIKVQSAIMTSLVLESARPINQPIVEPLQLCLGPKSLAAEQVAVHIAGIAQGPADARKNCKKDAEYLIGA